MLRRGKLVTHTMDRRFEGRSGRCGIRGFALLFAAVSLVLTLGVAALSASSAPSFARARSYATGDGPGSVAIGDLNADGKPDLVSANGSAHTASVLLNEGDGSFETKHDYAAGRNSVSIGDLNGDGKPDLATVGRARTVSVQLNRGDGSFQAKLDYRTRSQPTEVAIGDLNGDRRSDLVTTNDEPSGVAVLLNRGDGSFQPELDYRTGRLPRSVAIGDLNGDRSLDLVTANVAAATVSVLLNRRDGRFRARRDYRTGRRSAEPAPVSVAIGDLNHDRKPDLVTANYGDANTVSVLDNRGDGSFRTRREYRTGRLPTSVAIGDLNGDGKPDLATANQGSGNLSVLASMGDGSFRPKLDYAYGRGPSSVAISDLNGDRRPELVTANGDADTVSVLLNTPGLCTVQNVQGNTLPAAKRTILRATCLVGKVTRSHSKTVRRGRVISQKPRPGTVLTNGGKVNLVVSRGREPS